MQKKKKKKMSFVVYVLLEIPVCCLEHSEALQPYEPHHEKTCLWGLRPGKIQTGLLSYRLARGLKFWI